MADIEERKTAKRPSSSRPERRQFGRKLSLPFSPPTVLPRAHDPSSRWPLQWCPSALQLDNLQCTRQLSERGFQVLLIKSLILYLDKSCLLLSKVNHNLLNGDRNGPLIMSRSFANLFQLCSHPISTRGLFKMQFIFV